MTKLTDPQRKILFAILTDDFGAAYRGKSASALHNRMMIRKLSRWNPSTKTGRELTPEGAKLLHDWYKVRWAKSGCLAHQQDLDKVEALIAAVR
jgi:hypothetical protein